MPRTFQGRGISLVQTVSQMQDVDISNTVAQHYISNPLLLDGCKFDLRIYALVTSVDPLKVGWAHSQIFILVSRHYTTSH